MRDFLEESTLMDLRFSHMIQDDEAWSRLEGMCIDEYSKQVNVIIRFSYCRFSQPQGGGICY